MDLGAGCRVGSKVGAELEVGSGGTDGADGRPAGGTLPLQNHGARRHTRESRKGAEDVQHGLR